MKPTTGYAIAVMAAVMACACNSYGEGYADSPWPMYGGDPANTFRIQSYDAPPSSNRIKWKYETSGYVRGVSIGSDGTIYAASSDGLYAVNPDGSLHWQFDMGDYSINTAPAIAENGTLFFRSSGNNTLYAVNPDGSLQWSKTISGDYPPPKIDDNGTIYVASTNDRNDNNLYALNPDDSLKWAYDLAGTRVDSAVAVDGNGSVYFTSGNSLFALKNYGALKWKTGSFNLWAGVTFDDSRDTVYARSIGSLYAFDKNSLLKWRYSLRDDDPKTVDDFESPPSLGRDGTVYIGTNQYLYALNPDGTVKWRFKTVGIVKQAAVVGSDGCLYFSTNNPEGNAYLYAVNSDGTLRWDYEFDSSHPIGSEVAIGRDGTLYVGMRDHYLYAFAPEGQTAVDEEPKPEALPAVTSYPNPFNPSTTISFTLPASGHTVLSVYNLSGQKVTTLVNCLLPAGRHDIEWNGSDDTGVMLASGVYLAVLRQNGNNVSHRMLLMK